MIRGLWTSTRWWTPARATPSYLPAFSGNWGVEPIDKIALALADGQRVEMDLGQATTTIDVRSIPTLGGFGRDNPRPLLGAYTFEGLHLAVDPVH